MGKLAEYGIFSFLSTRSVLYWKRNNKRGRSAPKGSEALESMICILPGPPKFDAIPTYKITCYPLERRDYKPFAQAQVCVTPKVLAIRLWAFESRPKPLSRVEAVFGRPDRAPSLRVTAWAEGRWRCVRGAAPEELPLDAGVRPMAGDDFQGEYWGISLTLSRSLAEEALGLALEPGAAVLGNFYKRSCDPEKPHDGSFWPADFAGGREYDRPSLARFTVVRY